MKRNILWLNLLLLFFINVGCEDLKFGNKFLDKPLGTTITIDTVYSNKKYADQALNQAYKTLPDYMPLGTASNYLCMDAYSDLCYSKSSFYVTGNLASNYTSPFPFRLDQVLICSNVYKGIRNAWLYIENVDRVPDMSAEEKAIRKAEAKAIIAYHYMYVIRFYGGFPWIDHSYKFDDDFTFERLTLEETVNKTVALLDEAALDLPWYVSDDQSGRMTAAACKALKFRLLHFVASPLFNNNEPYAPGEASDKKLVWYGNYSEERWRDALEAGREFLRMNELNNNYYTIIDTDKPREDYVNGYWVRGSHEIIVSSHRYAIHNKGVKTYRAFTITNQSPRSSYADMFQMKDGTEFDWNNDEHRKHPYFDKTGEPVRDIRLYETLLVNGDKYQGREARVYLNGDEGQNGKYGTGSEYGYGPRKFIRDWGDEMNNKPYVCPLMRMPEIYLGIAEIMNELGMAHVKDEFGNNAYDYVFKVRDRAGLPGIDHISEGVDFREAVLRERALEFGYEQIRYFDIIRWKRGNDIFTRPLESLETTKESNGTFTYEVIKYEDMHYKWSEHWYLMPFALAEIQKKCGLIQNPGW